MGLRTPRLRCYWTGTCSIGGVLEAADWLCEPLARHGLLEGWTPGSRGAGVTWAPRPVTRTLRLSSRLDASVNLADPRGFEARYVRRDLRRAIAYVSTQSGCRQGCAMCWLTATGQRSAEDADVGELVSQVRLALAEYDRDVAERGPAGELHVNFMARGEPLASRVVRRDLRAFVDAARQLADARGLDLRVLVSTILPRSTRDLDLAALVADLPVEVYWSWYSSRPDFRRRWLPAADGPERGFDRLAALAAATGRPARVHFALIAGENDRPEDAGDLAGALSSRGLRARVNLVRYNPPPGHPSAEAADERYEVYAAALRRCPQVEAVKVVPRVGLDVRASCGTFLARDELREPTHR